MNQLNVVLYDRAKYRCHEIGILSFPITIDLLMAWHEAIAYVIADFMQIGLQGPLLLTWINFNPSMDMQLHPL